MVKKMLEKEYERKLIIDCEKFNLLLEDFTEKFHREEIFQINYYYDTPDFSIFNSGETLRVRQIDDILKLQYKYNKSRINDVRISDEYSEKINELPKIITVNDIETYNIGFMVTHRHNFNFEDCIVSLDKNYYLGVVDYEIEVEAEKENELPDILKELNFSSDSIGKYSRFAEKLLKQGFRYEVRK